METLGFGGGVDQIFHEVAERRGNVVARQGELLDQREWPGWVRRHSLRKLTSGRLELVGGFVYGIDEAGVDQVARRHALAGE